MEGRGVAQAQGLRVVVCYWPIKDRIASSRHSTFATGVVGRRVGPRAGASTWSTRTIDAPTRTGWSPSSPRGSPSAQTRTV